MEFTAEQKAAIEVDVKESLKHLSKALVKTASFLAANSENKIDDIVVKAKASAAEEIASESKMKYIIYKGSELMSTNIFDKSEIGITNSTLQ